MNFFDILKNIPVPAEFGVIESNCDDLSPAAEVYCSAVHREAKLNNISISTFYGCSQFVIVTEDKQVYKVPFLGFYFDEGEYDAYFEEFEVNHSARTVDLYESSILEGVDAIFAETAFVGYSCNHYPIYQQSYARNFRDDTSVQPSEESTTAAKRLSEKEYVPFERQWFALAIEYFGEDFMKKVLKFIHDYDIDDLHRGNYGFDESGIPVLYDYCGFYPERKFD